MIKSSTGLCGYSINEDQALKTALTSPFYTEPMTSFNHGPKILRIRIDLPYRRTCTGAEHVA